MHYIFSLLSLVMVFLCINQIKFLNKIEENLREKKMDKFIPILRQTFGVLAFVFLALFIYLLH